MVLPSQPLVVYQYGPGLSGFYSSLVTLVLIVIHSLPVQIDYFTYKHVTLVPRTAYFGIVPGPVLLSTFGIFFKRSLTLFLNFVVIGKTLLFNELCLVLKLTSYRIFTLKYATSCVGVISNETKL